MGPAMAAPIPPTISPAPAPSIPPAIARGPDKIPAPKAAPAPAPRAAPPAVPPIAQLPAYSQPLSLPTFFMASISPKATSFFAFATAVLAIIDWFCADIFLVSALFKTSYTAPSSKSMVSTPSLFSTNLASSG
mgnify:CR=1 FL=1